MSDCSIIAVPFVFLSMITLDWVYDVFHNNSTAHIHLVYQLVRCFWFCRLYEKCLTSQKVPEYPVGQLQVMALPSFSIHCPPCRQGALSQRLGPFWQYFPEKPGGHKHLDPDTRSFVGHTYNVCYLYWCEKERAMIYTKWRKKALKSERGGLSWICHRHETYYSQTEAK